MSTDSQAKGGEQTCQAEGETERERALFISTQRAFEGGFNGDAAEKSIIEARTM